MRNFIYCLLLLSIEASLSAQKNITPKNEKPKLVIGIVIDQMRWDFLYRYENRYGEGGFKRLLNEGFSCENTYIPYAPTVTAAGHASIYTGSVPSINGIAGNEWYDRNLQTSIYCASDSLVKGVGTDHHSNGRMSPRNLWTTTLSDELRLATNFEAKVVGVCIKDRGAIFPAGHSATAAYWYDSSNGRWITSNYYMEELPKWLQKLNESNIVAKYYKNNWKTLYNKNSYTQSTKDEQTYEGKFKRNPSSSLPYRLDTLNNSYGTISATPYGNSMTLEVARAAIENHDLGKDKVTDLLALSLSSPDYIGHQFGPNSVEIEDTYLRLDLELADFLLYLDKKIGKDQYTVFLSADHGVAHIPGFLKQNKLPGDVLSSSKYIIDINDRLKDKYKIDEAIKAEHNYQLYLNHKAIDDSGIPKLEITQFIIDEVKKHPGVLDVFAASELATRPLPVAVKEKLINGYNIQRSGDLEVILKPGYFDGWVTGTTHGSPFPYDTHIPLLFFGKGIKQGKCYRNTYMTDVAPTMASLLQIQMPNGTVGQAIPEVFK